MSRDLFARGMKIRRAVLGDAYVDRAMDSADDFSRDFQKLVTEYCWGAVWGGRGLTLRQRSLHNLCLLAALNRREEFELHFRGALRNGCSLEELRETLLQIAIYAGIPAGVEAFRVARKVLSEHPKFGDRLLNAQLGRGKQGRSSASAGRRPGRPGKKLGIT